MRWFIMLFLFAPNVYGMGDNVQQWWSNSYQQQVVPQQRKLIKDELQEECDYNIARYKVKQSHYKRTHGFESAYYAVKIQEWEDVCKDDQ